MDYQNILTTEDELRQYYDAPVEGAVLKERDYLNDLAIQYIADCPFLMLATASPDGLGDCSPKGDPAGFVKVINNKLIAIPDRKGNNRLDSLLNIIKDPRVGLFFMIPGRHEALRVNGTAKICADPDLLEELAHKGRRPTSCILVEVKEAYFHCPKAIIRAKLWKPEITAADLDGYMQIKADVFGMTMSAEERAKHAQDYKDSLEDRLY